ILQGGIQVVRDAGAVLVGGHSVEDDEPKYGLAVTGIVHPDKMMTNAALEPGDRLILTKKVGTGVIATALKAGLASQSEIDEMVSVMCALNKSASEVAVSFGVRACTDVTGFGLAGHLVEMAAASRCKILVYADRVPLLPGALQWASMGLLPGGVHANRKYFGAWIDIAPRLSLERVDLMFDPQTSGGLILGVPEAFAGKVLEALHQRGVSDASQIGQVLQKDPAGRLEIA
ncbi:MAG: selenide, water dikinase SelD, partial [Desulfomonilaceae bacterium]